MSPIVVLVANEPRVHREAIAGALALLRPESEVVEIEPDAVEAAVVRRRPNLLICSALDERTKARVPAWVLLYPEGENRVETCVRGERAVARDISLVSLAALVDRVAAASADDRMDVAPASLAATARGVSRVR